MRFRHSRHGFAMVIFTTFVVFLAGAFLVFLIDFGRAYIVKAQLRAMCDAAALSAAQAYENLECDPPACTNELEARRDAAYAAAQLIADSNPIMGLGAMNLAQERGIILGNYEEGAFAAQDPLNPDLQINSARVTVKLGENTNPLFPVLFNQAAHNIVGDTMAFESEAIGTMEIDGKTLMISMALDSSGSMSYNKFCPRGTWEPCSAGPSTAPACKGVDLPNGKHIACPPIWYVASPNGAPCHPGGNWQGSKFPVWCNQMPSYYSNYRLPPQANQKYPNNLWVPEPMNTILEASKTFVDEVQALNDTRLPAVYWHQVGINKFTSDGYSKIVIRPTRSYNAVKNELQVEKIFPMYATDVCEGLSDSFDMLEDGWLTYNDDKDRLVPVVVLISDLNSGEPNRVCGYSPSSGAQGQAWTLSVADQLDNQYFNLTGERAMIFTIMVMNQPPDIEAFMRKLARNGGSYIFAPNPADIENAFKEVVKRIQDLKLVK